VPSVDSTHNARHITASLTRLAKKRLTNHNINQDYNYNTQHVHRSKFQDASDGSQVLGFPIGSMLAGRAVGATVFCYIDRDDGPNQVERPWKKPEN
jgi:hypothetical protein